MATGRPDAVAALVTAIRATERNGNLRTAAVGRRDLAFMLVKEGRLSAAHPQLRIAARL
ncbi:MAG: hypothetical protein IPM11_11290 [Micropruina sp.]|nr:hypothetical protein [Micropruina sp.]